MNIQNNNQLNEKDMTEVTLKLKDIAEALVVSYEFNSEAEQRQTVTAYKMILGEEVYAEVCKLAHAILDAKK